MGTVWGLNPLTDIFEEHRVCDICGCAMESSVDHCPDCTRSRERTRELGLLGLSVATLAALVLVFLAGLYLGFVWQGVGL